MHSPQARSSEYFTEVEFSSRSASDLYYVQAFFQVGSVGWQACGRSLELSIVMTVPPASSAMIQECKDAAMWVRRMDALGAGKSCGRM